MVQLTHTELVKELKEVNAKRIELKKLFEYGIYTEEEYQIEYSWLMDKLDNWQKYYTLKK
jgi:hypothetical protein